VLIKEGEPVQKGQSLIRLGDESDANYAAAQLELVNAQQDLNNLVNTSGSDLAQIVIDLKDAKEAHQKAENYLHYLQTAQRVPQTDTRVLLVQTWKGYHYEYKIKNFKGPAPQDWITEAENDLALKTAKLEELQRAYDRMKDGVDADQLAMLEARLTAAKAKVAAFSVIAPFDGVVADLNARVGGSISAGEIAVTVADFSQWIVTTTDVTEIDVVKLKEGQPVTVTLDAIPDVKLKGEILLIGQTYSQNQGDIVYEVTVLLGETNPAMRWGMTAAVKFE
jgi:HlyD family secretion protein